jgi:iron(III) transport system substrate-binding protein
MRYSRRSLTRGSLALALLASLACGGILAPLHPAAADSDNIVNVYSGRHASADTQLYQLFTQKTGIKVVVVQGKPEELMQRMKLEAENSIADVFVASDAGTFWHAAQDGLLQPITAKEVTDQVPISLRDAQNRWIAFSSRAHFIVYDPTKVKMKNLSTYEALADVKWQSSLLIRSSISLDNQSMVATMIDALGAAKAEDWARGLVQNFARDPRGADSDQVQAIINAEGNIAIVNTNSYAQLVSGNAAALKMWAAHLATFFPNQHDRGAAINISGAGIAVHSPHQANAVKFLAFLLSTEAQRLITDVNFEYPVRADVKPAAALVACGSFKADDLRAAAMAQNRAAAIDLMNRVGWR